MAQQGQGQGGGANVPPPPTFSLNPFASILDLSTTQGQKMWSKATSGSNTKFNLTNDATNAENFKQAIDEACKRFCWSTGIENIPIEWDATGQPSKLANIMTDFRSLTLEKIVAATGQRFDCVFTGDTHDFKIVNTNDAPENLARLRSVMVAEWILNSLSDDGRKTLQNHAKYFEYENTDGSTINEGATILLLVLQRIMPSTKVGVTTKKQLLMSMDPAKYDQDIGKMIIEMETLKTRIEAESKKEYDDFMLHVF